MHRYYAIIGVALTTALGLGTASAACIAPPANVTQWWLADGSSTDVRGDDDAILQHGATYGAGQVGQAFQLDGVDDYVNVPNSPALDLGAGDFTLNFWVKFNTTVGEQVMIEKYVETFNPSTALGWSFTKIGDDSLRFVAPPQDVNSAPQTIPSGTWMTSSADLSSTSSMKLR